VCVCSGKECQLLRRGVQTNQFNMPVTLLLNVSIEQLLFVTLDFKLCKRFKDLRNVAVGRRDLVAARGVDCKGSVRN
jgi:hypothetical protein